MASQKRWRVMASWRCAACTRAARSRSSLIRFCSCVCSLHAVLSPWLCHCNMPPCPVRCPRAQWVDRKPYQVAGCACTEFDAGHALQSDLFSN